MHDWYVGISRTTRLVQTKKECDLTTRFQEHIVATCRTANPSQLPRYLVWRNQPLSKLCQVPLYFGDWSDVQRLEAFIIK